MLNEIVRKVELEVAGRIDPYEEHANRSITQHLAEFEQHLRAKGVGDKQVKLVTFRARRIADECSMKMIGNLSTGKVQCFLAELRKGGLSAQTSNHYLRAIKQFTR